MLNAHLLTIVILAPTVVACTIDPFPARTSQDAAANTGGLGGTGGSDNGGAAGSGGTTSSTGGMTSSTGGATNTGGLNGTGGNGNGGTRGSGGTTSSTGGATSTGGLGGTGGGGTTGAGGTTGTGGTASSTSRTCGAPSILGACGSTKLFCGTACCGLAYPYYCPQTNLCFATQEQAAANCGNTACTACSPCSPCPAGKIAILTVDTIAGTRKCQCACNNAKCLTGQSKAFATCGCFQDTPTSPAVCVTPSTFGSCAGGSVSCGASACCPFSNPHYCPLTSLCYGTAAEAETACGSTTCYDCVGCGLSCPAGQTFDTSTPNSCACKSS